MPGYLSTRRSQATGTPTGRFVSLRRRILTPLVAASLASGGLLVLWAYQVFESMVEEQVRRRAHSVAESIVNVAESVTYDAQLERVLGGFGADGEVALAIVVGGEPRRVLASSRRPWSGRLLEELPPDLVPAGVANAVYQNEAYTGFDADKSGYAYTKPIFLGRPGSEDGAMEGNVLLQLDTLPLRAQLRRSGLLLLGGLFVILTGVTGLGYVLLRRHVLKPLESLAHAIKRAGSVGEAADAAGALAPRDEIGVLAGNLQKALLLAEEAKGQAEDLARAAEAASRAKADFLATMSHELRTPMNGVLGFCDLLARGPLRPDQKRHVSAIQGSGQMLLSLINDILDFSKIEAGRMTLQPVTFELTGVIREVADLFLVRAQEKGLALGFDGEPPSALTLYHDGIRVRQVLFNLIGNAVKFTEHGSIRVRVRTDAAFVRVEVVDTGIGISPSQTPHLFQRFSQADASTTRRYGGTGLGLAISRCLVELMGGDIGVQSELGRGATFWFTLPLTVAPVSVAAPVPSPAAATSTPRRVLLADDNRTSALLAGASLTKLGCAVETASSFDEAVGKLSGARFGLVLLDQHLPGHGDLQEAVTRVRTHCPSPARVVVMSDRAEAAWSPRDQPGDPDGFLAKPLSHASLAAVVESLA